MLGMTQASLTGIAQTVIPFTTLALGLLKGGGGPGHKETATNEFLGEFSSRRDGAGKFPAPRILTELRSVP